ncbi:hypothetical protein Cylst_2092 [Cylindrospermum stagnale PCC 7417]|uniref:Uncharacterized protein n=1 Tax=Cylindrospermum stagnale PCC 7417 TaxID=56107 RepID=K9WX09_9NOST|nr:hypothetical protein [Cylindrospermum stagnale]AFZ24331.1 hypothetical protein Cylst_2092 [Cylindrospermum stagnale PCC 7417]
MNFKNLRRCGYLLTLLASTVPSVVFGQAALANSTNEFFKPLEPSNPSVKCYCPRPIFNQESKPFIPTRYCPDFGGRLQDRIPRDCPLYLKPSINSTSVSQPIMLAKKEADEGKHIFGSVANPIGSQPASGEDVRDFHLRTGKASEAQLDRDRRSTVQEVTGEKHMPGGGPQN